MGGGGVGASHSESQSRPGEVLFGSPVVAMLANMFGIPVGLDKAGGFQLKQGKLSDWPTSTQYSEQIFGPGAGFENIANILDAPNIFGGDIQGLGNLSAQAAREATGDLGSMTDALMALPGQVGTPIDMSPIIRGASADLAEQFSASGGFGGSDFEAAALRTASELGVGEQRDAYGRRMEATLGGAPLVGALGQLQSGIGAGTASDLLQLGEFFNQSSATPQGRATTLLQLMAGMTPTASVSRGQMTEEEMWSWNANAKGYGMG